ncbi:MAG TPA: WD40 repeat domain-containing protein, partial [Pyrinomonadaceae bacterium]|nr:WD40 repeat domain-containing protein [Pyrinomonadaceae bacterium]
MRAGAGKYLTLLAAALLVHTAEAQTAELVVRTGHQHEVRSVAFSPDGRQVVTCGVWNGCKLWDTRTGQELRTIDGPKNAEIPSNVAAVFFHPDGRRAFTLNGGRIRTWDAATGKLLTTFGKTGEFDVVAISPDGSKFAVVRLSRATMAMIDANSGTELITLEHESNFVWERVERLAFSPDGSILAGGGPDNFVRLWSTATGKQLGEALKDHTRRITALAFSPDGALLASSSDDGKILLWNMLSRQMVGGFDANVQAIAFSSDGKELIGGDGAGLLRKWSLATGKETARVQAHTDRFNSSIEQLVVNTATGLIATASEDKTAKLLDLRTLSPMKSLTGVSSPTDYVAISPNGRDLVTTTWDGAVRLWSLDSVHGVRTAVESEGGVFDFSPDGRLLATSEDRKIILRDAATLDIKKILDPEPDSLNGATFTPDGRRLVTDDQRSQIKLWDVGTASVKDTLFAQSTMDSAMGDNIAHVAYSPNGRGFATVTNNGKFAIWDAVTKTKLFPLDGRVNATRIMFSPDGREVVAGAYQTHELWFWDASTGKR